MNDNKRRNGIIFGLMGLLPLLYASGFLAQMLENYAVWNGAGGVPGDGTSPKLPDPSIGICLLSVFLFILVIVWQFTYILQR